ncbi:unnamed protein product [Calypogeia fissa]
MGSASRGVEMTMPAGVLSLLVLVFLSTVSIGAARPTGSDGLQTYIVQMSKLEKPSIFTTRQSWYASTFSAVKGFESQDNARDKVSSTTELDGILHYYDNAFHGFAARLTEAEVSALESKPGVLRVHREGVRYLHTTHTPEFLGLNFTGGLLVESAYGEDVIIGVIDTGVWPERKSFSDHRIGPIPSRWKGSCVQEASFNASLCNKKLIGAKYYVKGYEASSGPVNTSLEFRSPRDNEGHGTHTSSTAGGRVVHKASLLGFAPGTARGVAPKARIAAYKVCWESGCYDSDILAAFDDAVADGVDVISLSVGGGVVPYYLDPIAIGAFGAAKKGIFVSCSAGNDGPGPLTVTNVAPWITTVAASTVDRTFPAVVKLGNGASYEGISLYSGPGLGTELLPVIWAGNASKEGVSSASSALCLDGTLDPAKVKGKIVLCDRGINARVAKGGVCKAAGAVGFILRNLAVDGEGLIADAHVLPGTSVGATAGVFIVDYILHTSDPKALIVFGGTVLGVKPAPVIASFSSRGPNPETPQILKPDITGPGVNILAAWTGAEGPTGLEGDDRRVDFNIISGTSMSCPHISGVAALLKGAQPKWSPAAIKSAIMTSAYLYDNNEDVIKDEATGNVTTPFSYGAGHVNPEKALDPGLVYDLETSDYVDFFCSLNYRDGAIQLLDPEMASCPNTTSKVSPGDLNYPSISLLFDVASSESAVQATSLNRALTNVGPAKCKYTVSWVAPAGVDIVVWPLELDFTEVGQKLTFTVEVTTAPVVLALGSVKATFGSLAWTDGIHVVRSPIVVNWQGSSPPSYSPSPPVLPPVS